MNSDEPRPESVTKLKPLVEAASAAIKAFDLEEAERQYRDAVDLAEHFDPPDPLALASALEGLASVGILSSRLGGGATNGGSAAGVSADEVEALRRRARELVEESVGPDSPAMADHLTADATFLLLSNKYAEADERLNRAIQLVEREPVKNGRRLMAILSQMALIQMQTGRAKDEEATLLRDVETGKTLLVQPVSAGADDNVAAALAGAYGMLAMHYNQQGRYREAEVTAREAIRLCEGLPEPPPQLRSSCNALAMALRHQWKVREGWRYYRRYMALENSTWKGWGWGTRLTMMFAHLLMFVIAPRIKPSSRPRL